jgi:hypothetical protein
VTGQPYDEPQTSVFKVNTEVPTKIAKKHFRPKTCDINRGCDKSDNEIFIDMKGTIKKPDKYKIISIIMI